MAVIRSCIFYCGLLQQELAILVGKHSLPVENIAYVVQGWKIDENCVTLLYGYFHNGTSPC